MTHKKIKIKRFAENEKKYLPMGKYKNIFLFPPLVIVINLFYFLYPVAKAKTNQILI